MIFDNMILDGEDERDAVYQPFPTARKEAIAIIVEEADSLLQERVSQARLAVARELRKIAADAQADDDAAAADRAPDGD